MHFAICGKTGRTQSNYSMGGACIARPHLFSRCWCFHGGESGEPGANRWDVNVITIIPLYSHCISLFSIQMIFAAISVDANRTESYTSTSKQNSINEIMCNHLALVLCKDCRHFLRFRQIHGTPCRRVECKRRGRKTIGGAGKEWTKKIVKNERTWKWFTKTVLTGAQNEYNRRIDADDRGGDGEGRIPNNEAITTSWKEESGNAFLLWTATHTYNRSQNILAVYTV